MTLPTPFSYLFFFFFHDTAPTEIYTLSLHDALPISDGGHDRDGAAPLGKNRFRWQEPRRGGKPRHRLAGRGARPRGRSEEHTSELQSRVDLVCRLLLEKKKKKRQEYTINMKPSESI